MLTMIRYGTNQNTAIQYGIKYGYKYSKSKIKFGIYGNSIGKSGIT